MSRLLPNEMTSVHDAPSMWSVLALRRLNGKKTQRGQRVWLWSFWAHLLAQPVSDGKHVPNLYGRRRLLLAVWQWNHEDAGLDICQVPWSCWMPENLRMDINLLVCTWAPCETGMPYCLRRAKWCLVDPCGQTLVLCFACILVLDDVCVWTQQGWLFWCGMSWYVWLSCHWSMLVWLTGNSANSWENGLELSLHTRASPVGELCMQTIPCTFSCVVGRICQCAMSQINK